MSDVFTFTRLRSILAPMIRPVLEHVGPCRRLAVAVLARRQPSEVELDGLRFEVHPGDFGVTLELSSTGDYEPVTRGVCLEALSPGMTFIDIGAHVGLFAIPASRQVAPGGRVIAFEPDPDNRRLLLNNIEANQAEAVTVVPAAVADEDGDASLERSAWNTGDHCVGRGASGRESIAVEMVRLDSWCADAQVEPDVIKMDVQGAEARVLDGMASLLGGSRPLQVLLEFSPSMLRDCGADPRGVLDTMVRAGMTLHLIDEVHGGERVASIDDVMAMCPDRGYVNLRCQRA